ncbi:FHA domain-containing protein [Gemmatimonadota bacterium]
MPKFTVLLGRRIIQVFDIDKAAVLVGRDDEMDVFIDNPSVSRRHAEFRKEGEGWVVEDLGSSNGTFLKSVKIEGAQPIAVGDEVGMGKFSIVFDKVVGEGDETAAQVPQQDPAAGFGGTTQITAHEVKELLKDSDRKRRAQIEWESGGRKGTHYLSDAPAVLFGTDDLCDVKVPKAPKHHVMVLYHEGECEVRNLSNWTKMKVGGSARNRHTFKPGESLVVGGLKLTFVGDIG